MKFFKNVRWFYPSEFIGSMLSLLTRPVRDANVNSITESNYKSPQFYYMYYFLVSVFDGNLNIVKEVIALGNMLRKAGLEELTVGQKSDMTVDTMLCSINDLEQPKNFQLRLNSFWY